MVIHYKNLVEMIGSYWVALASLTTGEPPIPSESNSEMDIQNKNLEKTPLFFHEI